MCNYITIPVHACKKTEELSLWVCVLLGASELYIEKGSKETVGNWTL